MPTETIREYTITGERSAFGRSTVTIRCPFCGHSVEAFVWSLWGSGKRCTTCRALFDGHGNARGTDREDGSAER